MGNSASTPANPKADAAALAALQKAHPDLFTMLKSEASAATIMDLYTKLYSTKGNQEMIRGAIRSVAITRGDYELFAKFAEPTADAYIADASLTPEFSVHRLNTLIHTHIMAILTGAANNTSGFVAAYNATSANLNHADNIALAEQVSDEIFAKVFADRPSAFAADAEAARAEHDRIANNRAAATLLRETIATPEASPVVAEVAQAAIVVADAVIEAASAVQELGNDAAATIADAQADAAAVQADAEVVKALAEEVLQ